MGNGGAYGSDPPFVQYTTLIASCPNSLSYTERESCETRIQFGSAWQDLDAANQIVE